MLQAFSSYRALVHSAVAVCRLHGGFSCCGGATRAVGGRAQPLMVPQAQLLLGVWNLSEPGRGLWPLAHSHILISLVPLQSLKNSFKRRNSENDLSDVVDILEAVTILSFVREE